MVSTVADNITVRSHRQKANVFDRTANKSKMLSSKAEYVKEVIKPVRDNNTIVYHYESLRSQNNIKKWKKQISRPCV